MIDRLFGGEEIGAWIATLTGILVLPDAGYFFACWHAAIKRSGATHTVYIPDFDE